MTQKSAIEADLLAAALLPAVLEAGRLEMAHFSSGVVIEKKPDKSPVTAADREAEAVLLAALGQLAPDIPVIAEEEVAAGRIPPPAERFFLVDALDGTRHFVRANPEFSINIGLVEAGRPVFGLIYGPAFGRLFLTRSDGGAYEAALDPGRSSAVFPQLRLQRIWSREPDPANLKAFNSKSTGSLSFGLLNALDVKDAQPFGSALKFCKLAAGEGDIYARLGETYEWDTASGQAILEAAGGSVTDLDGRPMTYGHAGRGYLNASFVAWGKRPLIEDFGALLRRKGGA